MDTADIVPRQADCSCTETKTSMELEIGYCGVSTFKHKEKTDNDIEGNPVRSEQSRKKNIQH